MAENTAKSVFQVKFDELLATHTATVDTIEKAAGNMAERTSTATFAVLATDEGLKLAEKVAKAEQTVRDSKATFEGLVGDWLKANGGLVNLDELRTLAKSQQADLTVLISSAKLLGEEITATLPAIPGARKTGQTSTGGVKVGQVIFSVNGEDRPAYDLSRLAWYVGGKLFPSATEKTNNGNGVPVAVLVSEASKAGVDVKASAWTMTVGETTVAARPSTVETPEVEAPDSK